jgi:hypothetical protein
MLWMGIVCVIAAIVAASVVLLFNPKQGAHKGMQANGPPPASIAENGTSIGVPALRLKKPRAQAERRSSHRQTPRVLQCGRKRSRQRRRPSQGQILRHQRRQ